MSWTFKAPPKWEGLYGFTAVEKALRAQFATGPALGTNEEGHAVRCGADLVALQALGGLHAAHPIYIGTEQITALPPVEQDAMQIIEEAALPFPAVFFDFCSARGPARLPLFLGDDSYAVAMYGVLVAEIAAYEGVTWGAGRQIIPLGCGIAFEQHRLMGANPGVVRYPAQRDGESTYPAAPMGAVMTHCTGEMPHEWDIMRFTAKMEGYPEPIRTAAITGPYSELAVLDSPLANEVKWPLREGDNGYFLGGTGTLVEQVWNTREGWETAGDVEGLSGVAWEARQEAKLQALLVYAMAEYAARCLYLLDSANVELVTAPVSRQVRRQAERSGTGIASVVDVRRTQVGANRSTGTGQKRNYSHRFERRSYYRHVTRGSHYKPDHVKPCQRRDPKTGELTCPDGCRREFVPATWVGQSGPMVPKSRRLSIPSPTREEDAA